MGASAMKYLGQRPKYEIYRVAVYEIRCAYEILSLWDNMMVLAGANISIKPIYPNRGPGAIPGFCLAQAVPGGKPLCGLLFGGSAGREGFDSFAVESGLEGDDGWLHREWMRFLYPKKARKETVGGEFRFSPPEPPLQTTRASAALDPH